MLLPKPDTWYLLHLEVNAPDPPYQLARVPHHKREQRVGDLSLVRVPDGEQLDLREWPVKLANELSCQPTSTEERSFLQAVAAVGRLRQRVAKAIPALFIGEIGLPADARDWVRDGRLVPATYRRELERA